MQDNSPTAPEPEARPLPPRRSSRRLLEPTAIGVMALGAVMMFQPFAKILFTYSFIVFLFGTLMFIVVSHLSE
ncbi:MAG: hypothetical protein IPO81_25175 [Kouleothrix sp.]|nr:hypothetical protein [Kouleothrix sp.]